MIKSNYKIIAMVSLLIILPIGFSFLATQYETCHLIKKNCTSSFNYVNYAMQDDANPYFDEVFCGSERAIYKDFNTGKCYGPSNILGNSPPPPNARLVWIGKGKEDKKPGNQDYNGFIVSGNQVNWL